MFDHLTYAHVDWEDMPRLLRVVVWCDPAVTEMLLLLTQGSVPVV